MQRFRGDREPERGPWAVVRRLDDQRVAFPVPARIAVPLTDGLRQVRTPIERDDAHVVDVLVENRDAPGRLEDLVRVVVARRQRRHAVVDDAALLQRPVFPRIVRVRALRFLVEGQPPAALRRQRGKPAVGRVDDERRPPNRLAAVVPVRVVGARQIRIRPAVTAIGVRSGALVERRDLFAAQDFLAGLPVGTFERRDRRVRPLALKIRLAPRRPGQRPRLLRGALTGRREPRASGPPRRSASSESPA